MSSDNAQLVLGHMRVPDGEYGDCYALGCFEKRVTVRSQQIRALNLLWALSSTGKLKGTGKVLVVGGGAGGMTAAAGAARLGYEVTLLEQKGVLLPLFRGNNTRWLHPSIYDWPALPGPERHDGGPQEEDEAGLPLLSWRAALAQDVAEQFDAQWAALPERSRIQVVLNVQSINLGSTRPRYVSWNANPHGGDGTFDAVILAVGFGFEREFPGVPRLSYWDNDRLHQPTRGEAESYLVSGCGDGGLIDLLRLKLEDFRHEAVVQKFVSAPGLSSLKEELNEIETEARTLDSPELFLQERYRKLKVPEEVDRAIKLRSDTKVTLNGEADSPLTLKASILSRFLASRLLYGLKVVPYRAGKFALKRQGAGYEVQFKTGKPEVFQHVLIRHGPGPSAMEEGFPAILEKCGPLRWRNELDQTRVPRWKPGFFNPRPGDGTLPPPLGTPEPGTPSPGGKFIGFSRESLKPGFNGRTDSMYNLLITSETGAWDGTSYDYDAERFLEYTDKEIREQFIKLDKDAVKTLCAIPTLFMYEKPCELPGRIGRVTAIYKHLNKVTFKFKLDLELPPIDWEMLEEHRAELHMPRLEHNRTHWAVKDVDLMEVLEPLLGAASFPVTAPLASHSMAEVAPLLQGHPLPPRQESVPGPLAPPHDNRMRLGSASAVDVAVITVIQPELFAVLDALRISASIREKTAQGTVYFRCSLYSHLAGRDYQIVVTCIGAPGNYDASAAASEVIATHQPQFLFLMGIAAGIRGMVRIGEVVISERVVAYEPAAVVASHDGRTSNTEHRPEIDRLSHAVNQDVVTYRPEPARLNAVFQRIHGRYPTSPVGKEKEFQSHVASAIDVRTATLASGEKLLRDPAKLLAIRQKQHGKVEVGEMEAAGVVAACRRANIPWLVIRGISDFGDSLKDNQFHDFASRAAATVLVDFLAHGLAIPSGAAVQPSTVPIPRYPDDETRRLSLQIERARERKQRLQAAGRSTTQVDQEILGLRRQLREGGQLRAGDSLGDGRFLLIESIGQGGFAHIWKAADRNQPDTVAIKVLHTNLAGDVAKRERFFRGARLMAELQHPAVVRVLERHGEDGGYHYFVMEYVAGGNFRQAVLKKDLAPDQVIAVIMRIGEALALAHSRKIIHRDVKPANILLDHLEQPLLTDFDLVGAADTTGGTRTGAMGTIIYAAPECLDRPQDADQRADVYGLGMTAIFGLYGSDLPFHIMRTPEPFLSQLPCPQSLKEVLARAISLEPAERYNDASEFLTAVHKARHSS